MQTLRRRKDHIDYFFDRSYILEHSKNYHEFLVELGVRKAVRMQAINSQPTITLTKAYGEFVLITSYPEGRIVKVRFRTGEEMHRERTATGFTTSIFHVVRNKLIEKQVVDGKRVVVEREFSAKNLRVSMKVNDVKCYRWYRFLWTDSIPSFGTETSRRMSLGIMETPSSFAQKNQMSTNKKAAEKFNEANLTLQSYFFEQAARLN